MNKFLFLISSITLFFLSVLLNLFLINNFWLPFSKPETGVTRESIDYPPIRPLSNEAKEYLNEIQGIFDGWETKTGDDDPIFLTIVSPDDEKVWFTLPYYISGLDYPGRYFQSVLYGEDKNGNEIFPQNLEMFKRDAFVFEAKRIYDLSIEKQAQQKKQKREENFKEFLRKNNKNVQS